MIPESTFLNVSFSGGYPVLSTPWKWYYRYGTTDMVHFCRFFAGMHLVLSRM